MTTTHTFTIPAGATVVLPGLPGDRAVSRGAVEQLQLATQAAGGSAVVTPGSSSDWVVTIPASGAVQFKLIAAELISEFGTGSEP